MVPDLQVAVAALTKEQEVGVILTFVRAKHIVIGIHFVQKPDLFEVA